MIVVDSSFLVEAMLRNAELFPNEPLVAPDLALYEVANVIWKHETLIKDLKDASKYLDVLENLIEAKAITLVRPDDGLIRDAYDLSTRYKTPVYDTVFIALALRLKTEFMTFDKDQMIIYKEEERI